MGGAVNADGQSAGDGDATGGKELGETLGIANAAGGGVATAHYGQLRGGEQLRVASYEEQRGRIMDRLQQWWISWLVKREQLVAGDGCPLQTGIQEWGISLFEGGDGRFAKAALTQRWRVGMENSGGRVELLQQLEKGARANARGEADAQPRNRLLR